MIENYNGYLPLRKLTAEVKKYNSIKNGFLRFKKHQNCLIKGNSNIKKLRRFFKKSDLLNSHLFNSDINHIFVLDNHALLVFTNSTDIFPNSKRLFYIYNNEFQIEIYSPYKYTQTCLNTNQLYYAYDFLNKKIDLIIDYFSNIYIPNLNLENHIINENLNNIVHYDAKSYISPHSDMSYSNTKYINLLQNYFQELNEFALKHYFLKNVQTSFYLSNTDLDRIIISITIKNGAYSVAFNYPTSPIYRYVYWDLALITKNNEILTYFSTKHNDIRSDINDDYAFFKEIFENYNMKEKLHIELQKIANNLNLTNDINYLFTESTL